MPLFFLGYAFIRREDQVQKVLLIFILCAAAGGVVSYIQSRLSPQQLALWGPGYSERVLGTGPFQGAPRVAYDAAGNPSVRPFGLGSDLGGGAVAASLALPALIAMLMVARGRLRALLAVLGIGIGLAVATSGTRAALVTTAVSVVAFALIAVGLAQRPAGRSPGSRSAPSSSTAPSASSARPTARPAGADHRPDEGAPDVHAGARRQREQVHRLRLELSPRPRRRARSGRRRSPWAAGPRPARASTPRRSGTSSCSRSGWPGIALFVALNLRLMALAARARIRRIADQTLRLELAALAAPLFGLAVAGFAGPTTASVPPAPYFWFVAGVLSYWLVTARGGLSGAAVARRTPARAAAPPPAAAAVREPALRSSGAPSAAAVSFAARARAPGRPRRGRP